LVQIQAPQPISIALNLIKFFIIYLILVLNRELVII
jgi:hypothetical protein